MIHEGREPRIANQSPVSDQIVIPGEDDLVKSEGGDDWVAYPDLPSTHHARHIWIMRRCARPKAPAFIGAPIPHRCRGKGDHASMITMAYFHPWTLRIKEADAYYPYAGAIRPRNMS